MSAVWCIRQLVMLVNCALDIYILYIFIETLFPIYEEQRCVRRAEAIICTGIIFLINHLQMPFVNMVCVPLICMLFVWLVFRISFRLNLLYVMFFYGTWAIVEFAFWSIYHFMGISVTEQNAHWVIRLMLEKLCGLIILQAFKKRNLHVMSKENDPKLKSLLVLPVTVLIMLSGVFLTDKNLTGYILICVGSFVLIWSNISYFLMVDKMILMEKKTWDDKMMQVKSHLEHIHYQRMDEINQEYAEHVHEMRHITKVIARFSETEKDASLRALSSEASMLLEKKRQGKKRMYFTDPILNAILIEREEAARRDGIRMEIVVEPGISVQFVNETDKIRLFGNLLDNAIEAAGECENGYVNVKFSRGSGEIIVFKVINNFRHVNKKSGETLLSTKKEHRRHGFGLKKARELAAQNNATLCLKEEDGRFMAVLVMNNMQKTEKK
ncbi:GHKL domain-containing protein [Clostridiaceae bacterium]|nr:GHKL domain-containing protein [Clostridiaceae bacterium]